MNIFKTISAFLVSGGAYVADASIATPDTFWLAILKETGLPTMMLGMAVYGIWHLMKKLSASEEARVQDQKEMLRQYREDSKAAQESRERLIQEMKEQTRAIKEKSS